MINIKKLTKNVITFLLAAATGAGKSLLASLMATKNAFNILSKGIGTTNTTLTNKKMVYSTNPELYTHLIVWAKKKKNILTRISVQELITRAWATIIAKYKNFETLPEDRIKMKFCGAIRSQINGKSNVKALLNFLSKDEIDSFVEVLYAGIKAMGLIGKSSSAYKKAANNLKPEQIKPSSHVFWGAIASELNNFIDNVEENNPHKQTFYYIIQSTSEKLDKIFYKYFDKNNINEEGYYVCDIDLLNQDLKKDFIEAMFKANDLSKDEHVSIEALCDEIVIYTGLNEFIKGTIDSSNKLSRVFFNNKTGYCEFALYDTMGVFHNDTDEDKSYDYFEGLTKIDKFAGILLLAPLKGDNNVVKMSKHIVDFLSHINYSTIVFLLRNNLNKYIRDEVDNNSCVSTLIDDDNNFDINYANEVLANAKMQLEKDFQFEPNRHIQLEVIKYLVEFRRFDIDFKTMLGINECALSSVIINLLNAYADFVDKNSSRIKVIKTGDDEATISLDKEVLRSNFKVTYESGCVMNYDRDTFIPASINIEANKEKTPHGLSYNALKRHLSWGDSFSSNIDEFYFVNCNNINITFPDNINKLPKSGLFKILLKDAIKIEGLVVNEDKLEEILNCIYSNINYNKTAKLLVYDYALKKAEDKYASYYNCFNEMLNRCIDFIPAKKEEMNIDLWIDALYEVYKEAIDMAFNYGLLITNN